VQGDKIICIWVCQEVHLAQPHDGVMLYKRYGTLFPSPAEAADGFIKMGTQVEQVVISLVISPCMTSLEYEDNIAQNYEYTARYMAQQEKT
jgi:hypothetical protein